ncbi:putative methyltransferase NSUN7 [Merluccius polli]|uniref:Methyltransferase NSUN7 n=1 Tax=Merluccius polli TaxID=89951 RepID=A0AA47N1V7_MERPO|nr:putative methyltransferase NSUN7 [Merluccius polli]
MAPAHPAAPDPGVEEDEASYGTQHCHLEEAIYPWRLTGPEETHEQRRRGSGSPITRDGRRASYLHLATEFGFNSVSKPRFSRDLAGTGSSAMDKCFVDSEHGSPGTGADPSTSGKTRYISPQLFQISENNVIRLSSQVLLRQLRNSHFVQGQTVVESALERRYERRFPLADQVYLAAGDIFQRLRKDRPITRQILHYGEKETTPLPGGPDKSRLRQAYQLAFNTLKYQDLLENIVLDSCFHTSQQIPDDLLPLAMVMLFDLQDRKFQLIKRPAMEGEEPLSQDVRDLESCFRRSKTKLAASLARCRVKQDLVSVSCVLPDLVRTNQNRAKLLPFYAWVNTLKSSMEEVCDELRTDLGLSEGERMRGNQVDDLDFCRDPLCQDTLCFRPQLHALIGHSTLTTGHVLNMQHRSVCVAVNALHLHPSDHGDVLVAGSFSACTMAHIAVHAAAKSGKVLVCGDDHTASQREEMQELLKQMDIKNVRILPGEFQDLDEWDAAPHTKVILLLPQCSSSALSDPVPTLLTEHGDVEVLQDLSQGPVSQNKLDTLVYHQEKLLAHALTFPKVQTVFYCTRSVYPQENEHLVKRVLEKTDTPPKLVPFRPARPLFPQSPGSETTDSRFFKIEPSGHTDGCFIARLTRESGAPKVESVQDVLARAAAKGLLGGIFGDQSQPSQRARRRKSRAPAAANQKSYSPLPGLAETEPVAGQSHDLDPDPRVGLDPDPRVDLDPASGPVATDTPLTIGAAGEEKGDAGEGKERTKKGLRKRKGRARRSRGTAKVSAVRPNRTGKRRIVTKVKRTHRQGPRRRAAREPFPLTPSFTPSATSSGRTSEATSSDPPMMSSIAHPTGQGRAAIPSAAHIVQMSRTRGQGRKADAKKNTTKAAKSVPEATRGAGAADEEVSQDLSSPVDLVRPLVSSFSASSLSNTSASSQSTAPSSSSSTPTAATRTRMLF